MRRTGKWEVLFRLSRSFVGFVAAILVSAGQMPGWAAPTLTTELVASGFNQPTFLTAPPNDTHRLFVLERSTGRIRIIRDGFVLRTPFLDLREKVGDAGEGGLLGLAFPPTYGSGSDWFYVSYSDPTGAAIIEAYRVSKDPDKARRRSGSVLLRTEQPGHVHYGGMIGFGRDGFLYYGRGDGSEGNDPFGYGQKTNTLLGKMLRIKVNKSKPYRVPASNPFVDREGYRPEIWALGLRNPWRWSFDRLTGDLYIGDVGSSSREEIDFHRAGEPAGQNFGWSVAEGSACVGGNDDCGTNPRFSAPIMDFTRDEANCIVGGCVYRGTAIPELRGTCFAADHILGRIWTFRYLNSTVSELRDRTAELEPPGAPAINHPASFGEDASGEMYIVDHDGEIFKIVARG